MNQRSTGATSSGDTMLTDHQDELTAALTAQGLQQYLPALSAAEILTIADLTRLTISDYATMGIAAGPAFKIQKALLNAAQQSHNNQQQTSASIASHVADVVRNSSMHQPNPDRSGHIGLRHHTATATTSATSARSTNDDADGMCKVCWEREINAMTIPCRHLKFCAECMIQPGTEGVPTMKECPCCRAEITSVMRIHM